MRMSLILTLSLLLLCLAGCTHIISDKSLERADRSVRFGELQHDPDAFRGKFVILGGLVTGIKQNKEGVQLEVIEYPLENVEYTYPVLVVKEIHIVVRPSGGYYRGGY